MKRLLLILTLAPAQAGAFDIAWPVDCTLGETCFIQNYFDRDPGPGTADFACGPLTYDGHDGTDIAVNSLAAMTADVPVLAAAPGIVRGIRDGMPDISINDPAAPSLNGRDCGNGVVIDHGDGWETQYCHMKQGSIRVTKGQTITQGTPLGNVGNSGNAAFPHLHFAVRLNGAERDPFANDPGLACNSPAPVLWETLVPYIPGALISAGFSTIIPDFDDIKAGLPAPTFTAGDPAIVLWAYLFGGRAGDTIIFDITGPEGRIMTERVTLDRTQAQLFRAVGKKGTTWPAGTYSGTATLVRNGIEIDRQITEMTIP